MNTRAAMRRHSGQRSTVDLADPTVLIDAFVCTWNDIHITHPFLNCSAYSLTAFFRFID